MNKFRVIYILASAMICFVWIFVTKSKAGIDFENPELWKIDKNRVYDYWALMPPPPRQLPPAFTDPICEKPIGPISIIKAGREKH